MAGAVTLSAPAEAPSGEQLDEERTQQRRAGAHGVVRTGLSLVVVQGVTWVATLAVALTVPRLLGAEDFGRLAAAMTIALVVGSVAGLGTGSWLVREIARQPERSATLVVHAIALRTTIAAMLLAGAAIVGTSVIGDSGTYWVVVLMLVGALFAVAGAAALEGLQAHHQLGRAAIVTAAIQLVGALAGIGALLAGGDLIALVAASVISMALSAFASIAIFWRQFGSSVTMRSTHIRRLAMGGAPFLIWELGLLLLGKIDVLMLAAMDTLDSVGEYALAARLAGIPIFVASILYQATYPELSAASGRDREWFRTVLTTGVRLAIVVTVPAAVGLTVLAPELIQLIAGSAEFGRAHTLTMVLAVHIPSAAIGTLLGAALFAMNRQRAWAMVAWIAAAGNAALNLVAIPLAASYWGNAAAGAAIVTVASELLMIAFAIGMIGPLLDRKATVNVLVRALIASAVMAGGVLVALPLVGPIAVVPLGVAIYGSVALLLGLLTRTALASALATLRRRTGSDASS
jgi:O-antigen/teichoic acid export membrane protein